ncbi:unnamed protein product, partial [Polarella glacialis]
AAAVQQKVAEAVAAASALQPKLWQPSASAQPQMVPVSQGFSGISLWQPRPSKSPDVSVLQQAMSPSLASRAQEQSPQAYRSHLPVQASARGQPVPRSVPGVVMGPGVAPSSRSQQQGVREFRR